jgi:hypothetical protein
MENRMNRVIRACIEMGDKNPIISIHDQGAGGNGNVLKEIVDPKGARFELRNIPVRIHTCIDIYTRMCICIYIYIYKHTACILYLSILYTYMYVYIYVFIQRI